jgi:hypothetical protein
MCEQVSLHRLLKLELWHCSARERTEFAIDLAEWIWLDSDGKQQAQKPALLSLLMSVDLPSTTALISSHHDT